MPNTLQRTADPPQGARGTRVDWTILIPPSASADVNTNHLVVEVHLQRKKCNPRIMSRVN